MSEFPVSVKPKTRKLLFKPIQPSVALHMETSYLICIANEVIGFYITCNTGLKLINQKSRMNPTRKKNKRKFHITQRPDDIFRRSSFRTHIYLTNRHRSKINFDTSLPTNRSLKYISNLNFKDKVTANLNILSDIVL